MAYTEADLTTIRARIASGLLEARFADGRRVVYQSLADMLAAERTIADAVSATARTGPRRRTPGYRTGN